METAEACETRVKNSMFPIKYRTRNYVYNRLKWSFKKFSKKIATRNWFAWVSTEKKKTVFVATTGFLENSSLNVFQKPKITLKDE